MSSVKTITVAAGQLSARPLTEAAAALSAIDRLVERAADQRVDLLVLPECAYPAYLIGSAEAYADAHVLSSDEYLAHLCEHARRHRLTLVSGFVETTGDGLANAAALIDHRGNVIGRYRKTFLWDKDNEWFAPGAQSKTFETDVGRIGMVICADTRAPETVATLVADGAELMAMPTCWVNAPDGSPNNPQPEFLIEARAREFGVPFVCANKAGMESETVGYCGKSRIVRADGSCAAEAPVEGETVIAARLVPQRRRRVWVADRWKKRLLSDAPPVRPPVNDQAVTVAVVPTVTAEQRGAADMGRALFGPLQKRGVQLAIINIPHEVVAERIERMADAYDITCIAFPATVEPVRTPYGLVGCVGGQAARSFAAARCLALDGAQWVAVFDAGEDLPILRARAVENRTFVLAVGTRFSAIIDPQANVLDRCTTTYPVESVATVDVSLAAKKQVAPNTDIFAQRRPRAYRFAPAAPDSLYSP